MTSEYELPPLPGSKVTMPTPTVTRWRAPITDSDGNQCGESDWKYGVGRGGGSRGGHGNTLSPPTKPKPTLMRGWLSRSSGNPFRQPPTTRYCCSAGKIAAAHGGLMCLWQRGDGAPIACRTHHVMDRQPTGCPCPRRRLRHSERRKGNEPSRH